MAFLRFYAVNPHPVMPVAGFQQSSVRDGKAACLPGAAHNRRDCLSRTKPHVKQALSPKKLTYLPHPAQNKRYYLLNIIQV